jgi:hypothetical protein
MFFGLAEANTSAGAPWLMFSASDELEALEELSPWCWWDTLELLCRSS